MAAKILKVYTCEHNYPRPRFRPSWRQRRRQLSLKGGVAGIKGWSNDWCLLLAHSPYRWQFLFSFISRTITLRAHQRARVATIRNIFFDWFHLQMPSSSRLRHRATMSTKSAFLCARICSVNFQRLWKIIHDKWTSCVNPPKKKRGSSQSYRGRRAMSCKSEEINLEPSLLLI